MSLECFSTTKIEEAKVKIDEGEYQIWWTHVLWYYLHTMTIDSTKKSKFKKLFKLAKSLVTVIHGNRQEKQTSY